MHDVTVFGLWHMHIYYILTKHIAQFNQLAKKLVNSLAISHARQEAKYRIYYIQDNDSGSIFS